MAITSLIDHIANHGTDGSVVVGANTPAPYASANLTGFVDGTGPQNASKNMAEFYNRQVFAAKHLVEAAGLTWDPANWAQMTQAVIALSGGLHGGTCAVTGPAAPPSVSSPYTKYTSVAPYFEEWEWSPVNGWKAVSNLYGDSLPTYTSLPNGFAGQTRTLVAPRNGEVFCSIYLTALNNLGASGSLSTLITKGPIRVGQSIVAANLNGADASASHVFKVVAGDTIVFQAANGFGTTGSYLDSFKYQ